MLYLWAFDLSMDNTGIAIFDNDGKLLFLLEGESPCVNIYMV